MTKTMTYSLRRLWSRTLLVFVIIGVWSQLFAQQETEVRPAENAFLNSRILKEKACTTCHTIGVSGGTVGPILNQVGNRRDETWLRKWLKDPNAVKEGTKMPNFEFSEEELDEVVGYLKNLRVSVPSEEILSTGLPLKEKGRRLFEAYDCQACHRLGDTGRFVGPDLTWVGHRKSLEWEKEWLSDPAAYKPNAFMPNFKLAPAAVEALAMYVNSQVGQQNKAGVGYERLIMHPYFSPGTPADRGYYVFKRFACWSCHGEDGRGGIETKNSASSSTVPKLVGITNKLADDAIKTIVRNGIKVARTDPAGPEPYQCISWEGKITDEEVDNLIAYLKKISPKKLRFRIIK